MDRRGRWHRPQRLPALVPPGEALAIGLVRGNMRKVFEDLVGMGGAHAVVEVSKQKTMVVLVIVVTQKNQILIVRLPLPPQLL